MKTIYITMLGLLLIAFGIDHFSAKIPPQLSSSISAAPVVDEVIAIGINLPADKTVTTEDVEAGKYPVLAIRVRDESYAIDVIQRIGNLVHYDNNHDGIINNADPIFGAFALAYINPDTNIIRFVPAQQAGLTGIILDMPSFLQKQSTTGLPAGYWRAHSIYVMSDGSKWLGFHVPMPPSFINQLTTEENSQQKIITVTGTTP